MYFNSIFVPQDIKRTSDKCNQMKKPNIEMKDYVDNQSVVFDNNEEEFFDEPAINTGAQEILCSNITPPIT